MARAVGRLRFPQLPPGQPREHSHARSACRREGDHAARKHAHTACSHWKTHLRASNAAAGPPLIRSDPPGGETNLMYTVPSDQRRELCAKQMLTWDKAPYGAGALLTTLDLFPAATTGCAHLQTDGRVAVIWLWTCAWPYPSLRSGLLPHDRDKDNLMLSSRISRISPVAGACTRSRQTCSIRREIST